MANEMELNAIRGAIENLDSRMAGIEQGINALLKVREFEAKAQAPAADPTTGLTAEDQAAAVNPLPGNIVRSNETTESKPASSESPLGTGNETAGNTETVGTQQIGSSDKP
jgi:hypothetical protein